MVGDESDAVVAGSTRTASQRVPNKSTETEMASPLEKPIRYDAAVADPDNSRGTSSRPCGSAADTCVRLLTR